MRTIAVLNALAESEGALSVRAVAELAGTSRSAAHRILQHLADEGYARQRDEGRYLVGPRLMQLASRVLSSSTLVDMADLVMQRLMRAVNESVYLAMYLSPQHYATFIHKVESNHQIRFVQTLGNPIPLHAGAVGKAILAVIDEVGPEDLELTAFTPNTIASPERLRAELEEIRERGYAVSVEERVPGASGIASVISSKEGVVGALTVTVPAQRLDLGQVDAIGREVVKHAAELSAAITATGANRF